MPPAPSQAEKNRNTRKRGIPRNYILNWQASRAGAEKPLVRRPLTACEGCRSAKVRCSGQQQDECDRCERCAGRGLECRYTASSTPKNSPEQFDPATQPPSTDRWSSLVPITSDAKMTMDLNFDAADPFSAAAAHIADEHNDGAIPPLDPGWSSERGSQGLGHIIDWASIDMVSSVSHLYPRSHTISSPPPPPPARLRCTNA